MTLIRTAVDSWADQGAPAVEHARSERLGLNGGAGTNNRQAFIHFTLPAGLLGATVLSAKLRVFLAGAWASSQVLTAERITQRWAERTLNWNNRPSVSSTHSAAVTVASGVDEQMIELDVGAMMGDVAGGSSFFGFRLSIDTDVNRWLKAAEAVKASLRPQLELVYSIPPDAPTILGPQGGRAVSIALPTFRWAFRDPDVGSSQASYQVQVDDAADFLTTLADTGKTAGTGELAISPLTINVNDVRYWRVRVWDDADVVSAWSDPVSFTRKAKGTLVINSPSGATVDDLSPTILWTYTPPAGGAMEAWKLELYRTDAGPDGLLYSTGRQTGAASSFTLPQPYPSSMSLIASTFSYRIVLTVWDSIDRDNYATDPDYVRVTKDFTYARSGAPAAVTSLTAAQTPAGGPGVLLTWQRSSAPDYFTLKVDGIEIMPRIDPAAVFVSGTTYAMTYWGATPRVASTYEIEAVVNSAGTLQNSDANATASLTVDIPGGGLWLVDPDDDTVIRIAGSQGPDLSIGESGTTHYLRGRRDPVRIVDTVRGYEGDVAGIVRSKADRDTFLELYGRLKPLRFIAGDLNILVELEGAATQPAHVPRDRVFPVSFGVLQVEDFTFDVVGG